MMSQNPFAYQHHDTLVCDGTVHLLTSIGRRHNEERTALCVIFFFDTSSDFLFDTCGRLLTSAVNVTTFDTPGGVTFAS